VADGGDFAQPLSRARYEDHVHAASRKLDRERGPDPGGRARDEGGLAEAGSRTGTGSLHAYSFP
jgi:hypothetical protein